MTGESEHVHNHAERRAVNRKNREVLWMGKKGSKMAGLAGRRVLPETKARLQGLTNRKD